MKRAVQLSRFTFIVMLCSGLMLSCKKDDVTPKEPGNPPVNPPPPTGQGTSVNIDTISNHLRFLNATKIRGSIPQGPSGSSLKISINDTLHLLNEIKVPVRFLHEDTTQNVAGAFVHIRYIEAGGGLASDYYDVPELPEMEENDTVSLILVGIDPDGLNDTLGGVPPAGSHAPFEITIVPYGPGREPLATTTKPVKIDKPNADPLTSPCGLVLPPGDYWDWHLTYIEDPTTQLFVFYNDHDKVWGAGGQFIKGCCIDGTSSYNINCSSDTAHHETLKFPTYFQFTEETLKFFENGTFARFTKEFHAIPEPEKSDFCGNDPGVVQNVQRSVSYTGNYTVKKLAVPFQGDSLLLQMITTDKTGGSGYSRSGGVIHQLDCTTLALIQPDREGFSRHEVSFFTRMNTGEDGWYDML